MILLLLLSRFWELLKQIFSASLAWSQKLPSVSLACLVSFLTYSFLPREVMSIQIWFVFRKLYRVIQSKSVLLSFVFLTPHPAHILHKCSGNRILLHFIHIFTKEKNLILKLLGTSGQHTEFDEITRFYHRNIYTYIEQFCKSCNASVYYLEGVFSIGFNYFLKNPPLQLS